MPMMNLYGLSIVGFKRVLAAVIVVLEKRWAGGESRFHGADECWSAESL